MKLSRAVQAVLSIACVAVAAGFGTSAHFYSESLSSTFFAVALCSVVIIQLRVCGIWPDGLILIGAAALLALVDFRFLHYHERFIAWISFFGLCSLLLLFLRAIWSDGAQRKLMLLAVIPSLLFVVSEWYASNMLDLTEKLHPRTLDLYLFSFDGSLHVQIPFLIGQAFWMWPWFKIISEIIYVCLPVPIALVYAGLLVRSGEKALPAMAAFLFTGPIGILFYNLFPAAGPAHIFTHGEFPWRSLDTNLLRRLFLEPIAIHAARNAIPSLHMGWVLLAWWYSRGLSWWERSIAFLFVFFTFFATMGTGEHYFIDLVVALPFALFMQALCSWPPVWKNHAQLGAMAFGLCAVLAWFAALRFANHFFWLSPVIPWTTCAVTVAVTLWIKHRIASPVSFATASQGEQLQYES